VLGDQLVSEDGLQLADLRLGFGELSFEVWGCVLAALGCADLGEGFQCRFVGGGEGVEVTLGCGDLAVVEAFFDDL
jgi:hypothetical protein